MDEKKKKQASRLALHLFSGWCGEIFFSFLPDGIASGRDSAGNEAARVLQWRGRLAVRAHVPEDGPPPRSRGGGWKHSAHRASTAFMQWQMGHNEAFLPGTVGPRSPPPSIGGGGKFRPLRVESCALIGPFRPLCSSTRTSTRT